MARRKTIVVVEDNKDNRLLIRTILKDQYQIIEYSSSYEAIDGLKGKSPDLFILDISLPGMDGVELLKSLRSKGEMRKTPAIAITAHALEGDRESLISAGFDDYVAKPIIDEDSFHAKIDSFLSQ